MADELLSRESEIYDYFAYIKRMPVEAMRTRIHGDYHLGQVIFTGTDFKIIDFEGEPARGIGERRLKRMPLKDVAGMVRSFDYAAQYHIRKFIIRDQDRERLEPCLKVWSRWMSLEFVNSYLDGMRESSILPATLEQTDAVLRMFVLEKALYEVMYELRSRPDWVGIPLRGVLDIIGKKLS